jgi:hypothetical protein
MDNNIANMLDTFYGVYGWCVSRESQPPKINYQPTTTCCGDFLWLHHELIDYFQNITQKTIDTMNASFDLESGVCTVTPCNLTNSYTESLYMLFMFLNGHLLGSPLQHKICYGYFAEMHHVICELCTHGVYLVEGARFVSQCSFVVLVRDRTSIYFVDMLNRLHDHHINVKACCLKGGNIIRQHDKVVGWTTPSMLKVDTKYIAQHFDVNGIKNNNVCAPVKPCEFSIWFVKIWNQSSKNMVHVEEMLLYHWIKFNSHYGHCNYDMSAH